jgi:hypothetical protein
MSEPDRYLSLHFDRFVVHEKRPVLPLPDRLDGCRDEQRGAADLVRMVHIAAFPIITCRTTSPSMCSYLASGGQVGFTRVSSQARMTRWETRTRAGTATRGKCAGFETCDSIDLAGLAGQHTRNGARNTPVGTRCGCLVEGEIH